MIQYSKTTAILSTNGMDVLSYQNDSINLEEQPVSLKHLDNTYFNTRTEFEMLVIEQFHSSHLQIHFIV